MGLLGIFALATVALAATVCLAALAVVLFFAKPWATTASSSPKDKHIQILVLGDIGRSPRMQYHALSVVKHGGTVDLVGYHESPLIPELQGHERVNVLALPPLPASLRSLPFVLLGPLKVLWQAWSLFRVMAETTRPARWIIIQNPPSIPTLHTALLISVLRGSHLLIDWHNYGWSILATTRGGSNPFVALYRRYEAFFGRITPTANLTVTDAMARQLAGPPYGFTKPIFTLHDRPAEIFQPVGGDSAQQRGAILARIPETRPLAETILRGDTRLIVSSTSWTPDEDFGLLLDALVSYAAATGGGDADAQGRKPIVAIITGKGPQKAMYQDRISQLTQEGRLPGIRIMTAWLSTEDYAGLLASADLGICLHKSSSGVDLPMKVVDMFGSGLPVAAYSGYESFGELVKEGQNGCGFETAEELSRVLVRLLNRGGERELALLKRGAVDEGSLRWDAEWDRVVGRIVGLIDP